MRIATVNGPNANKIPSIPSIDRQNVPKSGTLRRESIM
jgi:hypothetical protein